MIRRACAILFFTLCGIGNATAQKIYTYKVLRTYPHDEGAYTQGLFFKNGILYESAGQYGQSDIRMVDLSSGRVIKKTSMEYRYFGEGATMLGGLVYQLTWREGMCFVYDAATLAVKYRLPYSGEGWGLTNNDSQLIISDGSHVIRFLHPQTLREQRRLNVHTMQKNMALLNELELVEGELWANIYTTWQIARIDTATGMVTGIIDLNGILPHAKRTKNTDVLNGIAYDADSKRIFVTGKNWPLLFEIEIIEKK